VGYITVIGGVPCSGKSTLMKEIKKRTDCKNEFEYKLVKGHHDDKIENVILGVYIDSGEIFSGTDRLSMAVQPDAIEFLQKGEFNNAYIEGDRLFKPSFIRTCSMLTTDLRVIILEAGKEILEKRHKERGDSQSEEWIKAKRTTVDNIKNAFPCHVLNNNDLNEMNANIDYILNREFNRAVNPAQASLF
tara:strand:- start:2000 stop:2566 length:567 start_codon:yes stop_codon:yes gene_type:complete